MLFIQVFSALFSVILASMVNVRDDKKLGDTFTLDGTTFKLSKKDGKLMASIKLDSNAIIIGVSPDYQGKKLTFTPYSEDKDEVEWKHEFAAIAVAGPLGTGLMTTGLKPLQSEAQKHFEKNAKPDFMKRVIGRLDSYSALKTVVKKFEIARIEGDDSNKENQSGQKDAGNKSN